MRLVPRFHILKPINNLIVEKQKKLMSLKQKDNLSKIWFFRKDSPRKKKKENNIN